MKPYILALVLIAWCSTKTTSPVTTTTGTAPIRDSAMVQKIWDDYVLNQQWKWRDVDLTCASTNDMTIDQSIQSLLMVLKAQTQTLSQYSTWDDSLKWKCDIITQWSYVSLILKMQRTSAQLKWDNIVTMVFDAKRNTVSLDDLLASAWVKKDDFMKKIKEKIPNLIESEIGRLYSVSKWTDKPQSITIYYPTIKDQVITYATYDIAL